MSEQLRSALFWMVVCWGLLIPCDVLCDRIILKDGTTETSQRVWESEKYVHFILEGTQTVEVRYAKEIVERIETDGPGGAVPVQKPSPTPVGVPRKSAETNQPEQPALPQGSDSALPAKQPGFVNVDRRIAKDNKNTSFYDPHRAKRYWVSRSSHHDTLNGAIDALAAMYGQTKGWVEANMGEENDLGHIHSQLLAALDTGTAPAREEAPSSRSGSNPDSPQPIPASNIKEAPPETKDAAGIRPTIDPGDWPPLDIPGDLHFYDPRRDKRFWVLPGSRFSTLTDALQALAEHYGVDVAWIESHMGDTNVLVEIHRNIRASLSGP